MHIAGEAATTIDICTSPTRLVVLLNGQYWSDTIMINERPTTTDQPGGEGQTEEDGGVGWGRLSWKRA